MLTESQPTVAEIAAKSLAAVRVFERYGIDYCCGGKRPLTEVCESKGIDTAVVERELHTAMNADAGKSRDWTSAPIPELINHIVERHHAYLRREIPAIGQRLDKVYRVYNQRYGPTLLGLPEVYSALQAQLAFHLDKEESELFPALVARTASVEELEGYESEHVEVGAALVRIREITQDFAIPDYACVTFRALMSGLQELEQDIHLHVHLENNILFPRAIALGAS